MRRQRPNVYGTVSLGEIAFDDFFPFVGDERSPRRAFAIGDRTYSIKMNGHRCRLFRVTRTCEACGLVGTRLFIDAAAERGSTAVEGRQHFHVNLYAEEDGALVLMTKDHVVPASLGGTNEPDNLRVLCAPCNTARANDVSLSLEEIRARRLSPRGGRAPTHVPKAEPPPARSPPRPVRSTELAWALVRSAHEVTAAFTVGDMERARCALAETAALASALAEEAATPGCSRGEVR